MIWKNLESYNNSLLLKSSPNLELLVNQFNNAAPENNKDPKTISSFQYYDIGEMHRIKLQKNISLSLFYSDARSFIKNFNDLQHFFNF